MLRNIRLPMAVMAGAVQDAEDNDGVGAANEEDAVGETLCQHPARSRADLESGNLGLFDVPGRRDGLRRSVRAACLGTLDGVALVPGASNDRVSSRARAVTSSS